MVIHSCEVLLVTTRLITKKVSDMMRVQFKGRGARKNCYSVLHRAGGLGQH